MKDSQLLRYSRQIMLPQMDIVGQQALLDSTVLIAGVGGLGSPVALYLASAGVGKLILADHDNVDLSNLQRQIAHRSDSIGKSKVESAAATIKSINPEVEVKCFSEKLTESNLDDQTKKVDVVVDCTDNFAVRFALNKACFKYKVPLVSGAAIRMEGHLSVFDARLPESPCYQCLYKNGEDADINCSENGVLAPLTGVIGSLQAVEAIKLITGIGKSMSGRLMILDAMTMDIREIKLNKFKQCPVCSQ